LVADGPVEEKVVYREIVGSRPPARNSNQIFTPSNPQAVNQYVHEYNYMLDDGPSEPDHNEAMRQRALYMDAMDAAARKYIRPTLVFYLLRRF